MGISEVNSPITRKGSKAGSNLPKDPNTQTNPSSRFRRGDSVPDQPAPGARHSEKETKEE